MIAYNRLKSVAGEWRHFTICCLLALSCALTSLPARAAGGKVVARVNGEAIYEHELVANIAKDSFDSNVEDLKVTKLYRLIDAVVLRQFLQREHLTVDEKVIDQDVAELQKNPPSAGCMCCRYKSLQQFLDLNAYTMSEFRAKLRSNEGMNVYLRQLWLKSYPTRQARLAYVAKERARVTKGYVKLWQIFFNTFQQAANSPDPEQVGKEKKAQANKAWQRLQHGESFAAIAKAVSDDMMTREKGGALGCIVRDTFGDEVKETLAHLKPGAYSAPVQSVWGYHLIKWLPMSDADILGVLKQEFMDNRWDTEFEKIKKHAKIEKLMK